MKRNNLWRRLASLKRKVAPALPVSVKEHALKLPDDFDWQVYIDAHNDLNSFTRIKAEQHFISHGVTEGRLFNKQGISRFVAELEVRHGALPEYFDWKGYIGNYADLSFIGSSYQAAQHFLIYGQKEGRIPFRFDTDVYRSLYFKDVPISDEALLDHYRITGRPAGALATFEQIAEREGIEDAYWLRYLNLEEFNLLNSRWAGQCANKHEALKAMIREGFDRLAPISFAHTFDADYYADANPAQSEKTPTERYKHWLFEGLKANIPGDAAEHLKRHGLALLGFPGGFDWQEYRRRPGVPSIHRWDLLYYLLVDDGISAGEIPTTSQGGYDFLLSLAGALVQRNPARAAELFAFVNDRQQALLPADRERWADCLSARQNWSGAFALYREVVDAGASEIKTIVKTVEAGLKANQTSQTFDVLGRTRIASGGDVRWRSVLRDAIQASFREAWASAEDLYASGERAEADGVMSKVAANIEGWWSTLDPPGPPLAADRGHRVVMLANVDLRQCTQYRVTQKIEEAKAAGIDLEVYTQAEVDEFIAAMPGASAAIFYRLPALPLNIRAISICRAFDIPSYYDIDDLIFEPDHYPEPIETYGASVSKSFYHSLQMGVPLFRAAMAMCDYGIASTTLLAGYVEKIVRKRRCFVLPNGIDSHLADFFNQGVPKVRKNDDVVLFYGSGTRAHNSDFLDLVGDVLVRLMERHPNVRLMFVGYLSLDERFDAVRDRITQLDWTRDVQSYWSLLAEADINLAVLAPSPTTDCKSEIKWLEAAAFGVPSVVSATHRYKEVLEVGVDAFLAQTAEDWEHALETLIVSPEARLSMAQAARAKALSFQSLERNAERLKHLLVPAFEHADAGRLAQAPRRKKRILFFNIFFPPQTIGGSTRVIRDNIDSFLASDFAEECDFAVMTSDNDNPNAYQLRVENYKGIPVFRANSRIGEIQEWRPFDERYGQLFSRVAQLWQPDLVHVHSIQRGSASILTTCIRAGLPYVNTVHDGWWVSDYNFLTDLRGRPVRPEEALPLNPPYGKSIGRSLERRRRLRPLLERSAAILCVSDAFTRIMHESGYPTTVSVPNGVPHMERIEKTRSISGCVRMVQVSGETHHKGFHLVQAAFKQGRFANLELTIIDHQRFGGPVVETRWGESLVRFVGKTRQEDMHQLYATQDVLLIPSVWPESFGLVSREATQAGLWVIASDRGAVGEGIEHGVNGWVVDVTTIEPFLQTLEMINASPESYLDPPPQLKAEARTADDQARDLIGIYRDILGRPSEQQQWPYFMTGDFIEDEDANQEDREWVSGRRKTFFANKDTTRISGRNQAG